MLRLFVLALLIYGFLILWRKAGAKINAGQQGKNKIAAGEMVSCVHCGTFVLRSACIIDGERKYCSENCKNGGVA